MPRFFLAALTAGVLLTGGLVGDEKDAKDKKAPPQLAVRIVKVDAKKGEITVKYTEPKGKEVEKTYRLTEDVRLLDETGRVVKIDVKGYSKKNGLKSKIGDGDINWPAVCDELAKVNFCGWAAAEVGGGDRKWLADVSKRMDRVLEIR